MREWTWLGAFAVLAMAACDDSPPSSPPAPEVPEQPEPPESPPGEQEPARRGGTDPLLTKVCAAYDEVAAEGVQDDIILQSAAVRAVREHDVTEAQLAELGAHPHEVLASIRERGSPSECDAFVDKLEAIDDEQRGSQGQP